MAVSTIPSTLVPRLWAKKLWVEARDELYFMKFASPEVPGRDQTTQSSFNNNIVMMTDLSKAKGDRITMGLRYKLSGAGVSGDTAMEDAEEAMAFYPFTVTIERYRNAVLWDTVLNEQKSAYAFSPEVQVALSDWLAEKLDSLMLTALSASPTSTRIVYPSGNAVKTDSDMDASDVFSTTQISLARRTAELAQPRIRPIKVKGQNWFPILCHPYQIKALKVETAWLQAQREANIRGETNPIFSGATGVWDNCVIHSYTNIRTFAADDTADDVGAGTWAVAGARALLLGAQAGVYAFSKKSYLKTRETDYDSKGNQIGTLVGVGKAKYNSIDYATIAVDSYIATD